MPALNGPRPSGSVSPLGPPAPLGARPSASFPTLPSESSQADPFSREPASSTMNLPVPGRARAFAVIALAAAAAAVGGFLVVQYVANKRAREVASVEKPAPRPSPPVAVAPPPAPAPAAHPSPPPAAPPDKVASAEKPAPPKVEPTPAPPPAPAATPPPAAAAPVPALVPPRPIAARAKVGRTRRAPASHPAVAETAPPPAADLPASDAPAASDDSAGSSEDIYWLKVNSTPRGAEVLIDGQLEGRTPFQRRIFDTTRPYALTVRKPGFDPHEQMLSASDDWVKKGNVRTLTVNAKLPKAKPGSQPAVGPEPEKPADPDKTSDTTSTAPSTEPPPVPTNPQP
jgi:hypothetical protein